MMKADLASDVPVTSTCIPLGCRLRKDEQGRLADVLRFLGNVSPETILAFYAGIDETLALARWQAYLTEKTSREPKSLEKKGR